jgi:hypothetical protein
MIGLMWSTSNPKHNLTQRVGEAADAYRRKRGRWPTVCQVRATDDTPETVELRNGTLVRITTGPMTRHQYLLIGENGAEGDNVS